MEVLKEAAPLVNRMTVLHDPSQRNHEAFLRVIDTAAISLKVEVSKASIQDEAAIDRTVAALADRTDRGLARISTNRNSPNNRPSNPFYSTKRRGKPFHQGTGVVFLKRSESRTIGRWARRWKRTVTSRSVIATSADISMRSRKIWRA